MNAQVSNSNAADFLSLATTAASDAATNLTGGTIRLRDMSRNMLLAALAPDGKQVDGVIADIKVAVGWEKPNKWNSTAANNGKARQLTATELEAVKKQFAPCFTHVKFFVGEYSATVIRDDVASVRRALETGESALSTEYKRINDARKAAAKLEAEAEAKAASDAALANATSEVPPKDAEADAANVETETVADIRAMAERIAAMPASPMSDAMVAALELLELSISDLGERMRAEFDAASVDDIAQAA